jgi:hypothetical protein
VCAYSNSALAAAGIIAAAASERLCTLIELVCDGAPAMVRLLENDCATDL